MSLGGGSLSGAKSVVRAEINALLDYELLMA